MKQQQQRVIRYQFTKAGLNHRVITTDYINEEDGYIHPVRGDVTLCGLQVSISKGGWGYGPRDCTECVRREQQLESNPTGWFREAPDKQLKRIS